jgi:GNAT superfamily N-acetyltransferase
MEYQSDIIEVETDRDTVCRTILEALPDWFGIPEALENYVRDVKTMTMLACRRDGRIVGMVALNRTSEATVDMHVIGVLQPYHGQGIGKALVEAATRRALAEGARLLSVKTLGASHPDTDYAATRAFYLAAGFLPVEEFAQIWGADNPCLLMVKPIG